MSPSTESAPHAHVSRVAIGALLTLVMATTCAQPDPARPQGQDGATGHALPVDATRAPAPAAPVEVPPVAGSDAETASLKPTEPPQTAKQAEPDSVPALGRMFGEKVEAARRASEARGNGNWLALGRHRPRIVPHGRFPEIVIQPEEAKLVRMDDQRVLTEEGHLIYLSPDDRRGPTQYRLTSPSRRTTRFEMDLRQHGTVYLYAPLKRAHRAFRRGVARLKRADARRAVAAFTEATKLDFDYGMAWAYLGYAHELDGNLPAAHRILGRQTLLDTEALLTLRALHAVSNLRAQLSSKLPQLHRRTNDVAKALTDVRSLHHRIPSSVGAPVDLIALLSYWRAVGRFEVWQAQKATCEEPACDAIDCALARSAWEDVPTKATVLLRAPGVTAATSLATEQAHAQTTLAASCP